MTLAIDMAVWAEENDILSMFSRQGQTQWTVNNSK